MGFNLAHLRSKKDRRVVGSEGQAREADLATQPGLAWLGPDTDGSESQARLGWGLRQAGWGLGLDPRARKEFNTSWGARKTLPHLVASPL